MTGRPARVCVDCCCTNQSSVSGDECWDDEWYESPLPYIKRRYMYLHLTSCGVDSDHSSPTQPSSTDTDNMFVHQQLSVSVDECWDNEVYESPLSHIKTAASFKNIIREQPPKMSKTQKTKFRQAERERHRLLFFK
ncbi:uncharacterized protein LOC126886028 [Diabrotica virgifera virgifera]|uniref:Uncharacterized protein n=1 Tax=Diabrotica virgifera virgifera TaxID=50390 RepID=A0ABM5KF49_DIAVI|nr:uncharacterized protein LOC126886028 [Diabrotica virgifera virgifera]